MAVFFNPVWLASPKSLPRGGHQMKHLHVQVVLAIFFYTSLSIGASFSYSDWAGALSRPTPPSGLRPPHWPPLRKSENPQQLRRRASEQTSPVVVVIGLHVDEKHLVYDITSSLIWPVANVRAVNELRIRTISAAKNTVEIAAKLPPRLLRTTASDVNNAKFLRPRPPEVN